MSYCIDVVLTEVKLVVSRSRKVIQVRKVLLDFEVPGILLLKGVDTFQTALL